MKRAKIVGALTSRSYRTRLDEVEGTLLPLLRERAADGLPADAAKSLVGVVLAALTGVSFGKTDRAMIQLMEVIGALVAKKGGEDVNELASIVLKYSEKTHPSASQLRGLMMLLRGLCGVRSGDSVAAVLATRAKNTTSHAGKSRLPQEAWEAKKERKGKVLGARQASTDAALAHPHVQELLQHIVALIHEHLPEAQKVAAWYVDFPEIVPHVLKAAADAKAPATFLPAAVAVLKIKSEKQRPEGSNAAVAALFTKCCKTADVKAWQYVGASGVSLDRKECSAAAKEAFTAMAGEAKRAIESVLPALATLTKVYAPAVASEHGAVLLPLVEPTIKTLNDANRRALAFDALRSIARNVLIGDVRKAMITTFCSVLKLVKSTEERNVAMGTLNIIVPLMFELLNKSEALYQQTATMVKDLVYPAIKPYPSHACFELMGCCIARTSTAPDYIATTLKDVSTNSDESIRLRLLTMLPAVAEADPKKVKELQPTLAKMCADSAKKPGARAAALLALAVVDGAPKEQWYVDGCLGTSPMLFSIENLRRFSETWQLVAAVRSCQRFLPPMTQKGGAPAGFTAAKDLGPMIGLVLLATHPRNVVRSAATAAIKETLTASPALAYLFWTALMIVLWGDAPAEEAPKAASPDNSPKAAGAKAAAKPAGKKAAAKPAAKKGAAAGPAAAAQAAPSHPLVVDKKDYGKARRKLWCLSETAITEQFEHDRTEFPLAADVYTLLAGKLFVDEKVMSPELLREVVFSCGHSMVSGPVGQYWDCTTYNYAAYRNSVDSNAFAALFGLGFRPEKTVDSHKVPGHFLYAHGDDAAQGMVEALRDCGKRDHCRVAAARAMSFLALHSGTRGLEPCLVVPPPREAEMEFPPSDDEEEGAESSEKKPAAAKKPAAPAPATAAPAAEGEEPAKPSRLVALMHSVIDKMVTFTPLELKLVECDQDALFEAAVQKQLEDDDVIPRHKGDVQVKRDRSQKKLYSKEDEDWERAYIAKKNAELGIEDPKIAKARAETRVKFTELRTELKSYRQAMNGYLLAIIEVCRDARNTPAAHGVLPHLVPVLVEIIRRVPVRPSVIRAIEVLEWLFQTTPNLELRQMGLTLANVTQELVYERPSSIEGGRKPYEDDIITLVEQVSKRLRQVCSRLLPPPSYSIIFPICQTVMNHTFATKTFSLLCQQQVLAVVMTNCASPDVPHKAETSEALLTLTERTASMSKTATNALTQLMEFTQNDYLAPITEGLVSPAYIVREACAVALKNFPGLANAPATTRYHLLSVTHDANRGVARKAQETWRHHELAIDVDYISVLVPKLITSEVDIAKSVAAALADGTGHHIDQCKLCLQTMCREFDAQLRDPKALKKVDRKGIAEGFLAHMPHLSGETLEIICKFSCLRALCDINAEVREAFLTAFRKIVAHHGKEHHAKMFPVLQKYFQEGPPPALGPAGPAGAITPVIKEAYTSSVVVVMGTLSSQMEKPTHLDELANKLVEIAQTPSLSVAKAVCETMAIIIGHKSVQKHVGKLTAKCMEKLLKGSTTYQTRKSQAHALAGIVKGLHLPCLYDANLMPQIENALAGKPSAGKEGALATFSVFCTTLDGLFEPYVISLIRSVVDCFADKDSSVKRAAEECSGAMMASLSEFGVRQILPPLLESFETENWRTKVSALNLLGQMSYCSPQQLAAALPKVMPVLNETLTDTHKDVQSHAFDALRRVGGVITNPEIACHANTLLQAVKNPDTQIDNALEALLCTHFVNAVDAASLALIEPILRRGLTERVSAIKVKAASIIGSVALLVREKSIIMPYVHGLMTPLKRVLLDEFPDCRSTAAKAMGSLVNLLGVSQFPELLPWCFDALMDTTNSHVERSGAAQGACQLVIAYPKEEVEEYLVLIKERTHHEAHQVREGYLQVLVYLPHAMGQSYQPHLKDMTPCVVMGLSDETEGVRNMAVKAGQTLVHLFGMKCLDQLLPPLQQGLMNWEWRVRLSSLQLLGDLLMRVATENMKVVPQRAVVEEDEDEDEEDEDLEEDEESNEDDDDDGLVAQPQRGPLTIQDLRRMRQDKTTNSLVRALGEVIGEKVLGRLMSAIYMLTADNVIEVVRQARQVWKALVDNTPAMLRTIIEDLTPKLVEYITEDSEDQREIGGRCIGDLVSRLGDGFLPVILPILSKNLQDQNSTEVRLGAILGLKEVLKCISRAQLGVNSGVITPAIVQAIKDEDEIVREEAGLTFDIMFRNFGGKAIENLMQNLISAIVTNDETAMAGTLEMVKMRPKAVLAQLVPTFIKAGVLTSHLAMGLERVAQLAEDNICPHIIELLPLFCNTLAQDDLDCAEDVHAAVQAIVENAEAENLYAVMNEVRLYVQSTDVMQRKGGLGLITALVSCDVDLSEFNTAFIQNTIRLYADRDDDVQQRALDTMQMVSASLEEQGVYTDHTRTVHGALQAACFGESNMLAVLDRTVEINGKEALGLNTLLGYYTKPLQAGTAEDREFAAYGIVEILEMVATSTVKACVGDILGPMIRRMSETMPSTTKVAIMTCISACIRVVGTSAKHFIFMLQTAFPKNLANVDSDVRRSALRSMWVLLNYQEPKLDTTLNSLMLEAKGAHPAIQTAVMRGISLSLEARPEAVLGAKTQQSFKDILMPCWNRVATVPHAAAVGKAVGIMAPMVDEHVTREIIDKAAASVKEGGSLVVLGMAGWTGLLARGYGKPGFYHQDYVVFVEQATNVLPGLVDADQQLATVRACKALCDGGGVAEIGVSELLKLSSAMCKLGDKLLTGDREKTVCLEDTLRIALEGMLEYIPAKYQVHLNKLIGTLANVEKSEWETSADCQDDKREDEL